MSTNWLIYGATGYTARRIAKEAVARGLKPILAGRSEAVGELAKSLGLSYRIFSLDNLEAVKAGLKDVALVLSCAGPFSETIHLMLEACFALGVHYLDITGEIDVFEWAQTQSEKAVSSGSVVIPGVGFDVVPSDCLAASLAKALPGATTLELAFASDSLACGPGTLKTVVKIFPQGGKVRRDGKIVSDGLGGRTREIPFSHRKLWAVSIPGGDISTAYHSTKIPNITVFTVVPKKMMVLMKAMNPFRSVFRINAVQKLAEKGIERFVKGPDEKTLIDKKIYLWGEVSDSKNHQKRGVLECSEGYVLTADCALKSVERVLAGKVKPGVWTPSQAFGASFIEEISGSRLQIQQ